MTTAKPRWRYFPRQHRTAEERQHLYRALRETGLNSYEARMVRDWRFHAIECFIHCMDDARQYLAHSM
jgi:hypothetical protein